VVVNSLFFACKADSDWYFKGARILFPDAYEAFLRVAGTTRAKELLRKFEAGDMAAKQAIASACDNWEEHLGRGLERPEKAEPESLEKKDLHRVRVFLHYMAHDFFLADNAIADNAGKLAGLPVLMSHGDMDFCCPMSGVYDFRQKLPGAELVVVQYGGHNGQTGAEIYFRAINGFSKS
jgi:proline iminopeptidase